MKKLLWILWFLALSTGAATACIFDAQPDPDPSSSATISSPPTSQAALASDPGPHSNCDSLTPSPVTADPFPAQAKFRHAQGIEVDYYDHYKVVTILNPWRGSDRGFTYLLVQCGTPIPAGFDHADVITIPIQTIVTLSTTHLPYLENLDQLDALVGVSDADLIHSESVQARLDQGLTTPVSRQGVVDLERIVDLDPGLVMAFGVGDPEQDAHPKLIEVGLPVVLNAEYMETSPLGRAEWIKFMALFFNQEAEAEAVFTKIEQAYQDLAAKVATVSDRPSVLVDHSFNGTWYVPGGNSFMAQFLQDAGADYAWADDPSSGSLALSPEAVFDQAGSAPIWINGSPTWRDRTDILAEDDRYRAFAAFQSGQIYIPNARVNPAGGNDFWESGIINPHLILADLVKILHPSLLPEHDLVYYQQVEP